jgi:hypothetical protein
MNFQSLMQSVELLIIDTLKARPCQAEYLDVVAEYSLPDVYGHVGPKALDQTWVTISQTPPSSSLPA